MHINKITWTSVGPIYRAHRRFIGPWWISLNPDEKVKYHLSSTLTLLSIFNRWGIHCAQPLWQATCGSEKEESIYVGTPAPQQRATTLCTPTRLLSPKDTIPCTNDGLQISLGIRAFWCTRSTAKACNTANVRLLPDGRKNVAWQKPQ